MCKIRTETSGGGECRLLYRDGEDFKNECDSRFTLMMVNQTVFLHLSGLTPVDSGNHTCQCSHPGGTDFLHLNITVEGKCLIFLSCFCVSNCMHFSGYFPVCALFDGLNKSAVQQNNDDVFNTNNIIGQ